MNYLDENAQSVIRCEICNDHLEHLEEQLIKICWLCCAINDIDIQDRLDALVQSGKGKGKENGYRKATSNATVSKTYCQRL